MAERNSYTLDSALRDEPWRNDDDGEEITLLCCLSLNSIPAGSSRGVASSIRSREQAP